jgi:hypothetical protein
VDARADLYAVLYELATGLPPVRRPMYAYPYLSQHVSGNPNSLSSYTCVLPTHAQQRQLTALN